MLICGKKVLGGAWIRWQGGGRDGRALRQTRTRCNNDVVSMWPHCLMIIDKNEFKGVFQPQMAFFSIDYQGFPNLLGSDPRNNDV